MSLPQFVVQWSDEDANTFAEVQNMLFYSFNTRLMANTCMNFSMIFGDELLNCAHISPIDDLIDKRCDLLLICNNRYMIAFLHIWYKMFMLANTSRMILNKGKQQLVLVLHKT